MLENQNNSKITQILTTYIVHITSNYHSIEKSRIFFGSHGIPLGLSSVSGPDRGFFSKLNGTGPIVSGFKLSPVIPIPVSVALSRYPEKIGNGKVF